MSDETVNRILGHVGDIWASLKGIAWALDEYNAQPHSGTIFVRGVSIMTESETPVPIPSDDCPASVEWQDRLGTVIEHSATDTTWSAEDETGAASLAVTVNADLDSDSDDETAMVTFLQSTGQFRVVATTPGSDGPVRAQSVLYSIEPGAPAVGTITLSPA